MVHNRYFLPKALASALSHESAKDIKPVEAVLDVDKFRIPGFILEGPAEAIDTFRKEVPLFSSDFAKVAARSLIESLKKHNIDRSKPSEERKNDLKEVAIGSVHNPEVETDTLYRVLSVGSSIMLEAEVGGFRLIDIQSLFDDFEETLRQLSSWTGMKIRIFSPRTGVVRPFPKGPNELHVVVDASPPGETRELESNEMCKISLCDPGVRVRHPGPAIGYGVVIKDEEKDPVAQIVDGTFYLFVPIGAPYKRALKDEQGAGLFKKVLRMAWNAQFEPLEPYDEIEEIADEATYLEIRERLVREVPETLRITLPLLEIRIQEAEAKLRTAIQEKQHILAAIQMHAAAVDLMDPNTWKAEWAGLKAIPGIRAIRLVGNGLEVETNLIVSSYGGKRRPMGRYIIRLGYGGAMGDSDLTIRCLEARHPTGRPHPHIGDYGNACFGNISGAVLKAVAENRPHAIGLVMKWFTEGYDPSLAEVKIEEWSEEEVADAEPKLLASAGSA